MIDTYGRKPHLDRLHQPPPARGASCRIESRVEHE
jgi:hypothetical protein